MTDAPTHSYHATIRWTGNHGDGTAKLRSFSRDHDIVIAGKPTIAGSSDPAFLGDPGRHNPEEMLLASLSACHMLWYLALCSKAGVRVTAYLDEAEATLVEDRKNGGHFVGAVMRPSVRLAAGSDRTLAADLHAQAHGQCFIANSVNFPVTCEPRITIDD
jgi:organic hydroperoxide reductase OsmC/OhrA